MAKVEPELGHADRPVRDEQEAGRVTDRATGGDDQGRSQAEADRGLEHVDPDPSAVEGARGDGPLREHSVVLVAYRGRGGVGADRDQTE